ncbi:Snf7 family protein [Dioscorea alata]|uniref:Snf7 family protein n=1 Tax=Dioscorea alata TaxID=55571 RepID=A0ACB7WLI2_DIOAL|nr:Snf7 family protein [Dioscorea alata]
MFSRFFENRNVKTDTIVTVSKLNESLQFLEKKEKTVQKKMVTELEKAREFIRAKNKGAAMHCLKKKKRYEQQIELLGNYQLRIHDQLILIESASVTTQTVDALRSGAAKLKEVQKKYNINSVDKTLDEINEQTENLRLVQDALSVPLGSLADLDEDELEMELEELDALGLEDDKILSPVTTAPTAPVSSVPEKSQPIRPTPQKESPEVDELTALQAQMAL